MSVVFQSPRFGLALDVNFLGIKAKICSFDCAYCNLGPTEVRLTKLKDTGLLPAVSEILAEAQLAFKKVHEHGPMIQTILISGNGDGSVHPDFAEIVDGLIELRKVWLPGKPIVLLTNGANLDQRRMTDAVNKLDQRIVKIDAGNERLFKELNSPLARVTLQKVIGGIRLLKDVTIQALFVQGRIDNTGASDIEDWIEVIGLLKPKSVQIQSLSEASERSGLTRCDEDTLHTIASKLERRTGLKAQVF